MSPDHLLSSSNYSAYKTIRPENANTNYRFYYRFATGGSRRELERGAGKRSWEAEPGKENIIEDNKIIDVVGCSGCWSRDALVTDTRAGSSDVVVVLLFGACEGGNWTGREGRVSRINSMFEGGMLILLLIIIVLLY